MRRKWIQTPRGFVEVSTVRKARPPVAPAVFGDVSPHYNHHAGEWVSSRKRHREILREHGLVELGNEWSSYKKLVHNPDFDESGNLVYRDEQSEPPGWVEETQAEWLKKQTS